jgi:hypothetical protein
MEVPIFNYSFWKKALILTYRNSATVWRSTSSAVEVVGEPNRKNNRGSSSLHFRKLLFLVFLPICKEDAYHSSSSIKANPNIIIPQEPDSRQCPTRGTLGSYGDLHNHSVSNIVISENSEDRT